VSDLNLVKVTKQKSRQYTRHFNKDRLSSLAMLSIKKNFVMNIPDFNNKVIDVFAESKKRRLDFTYKTNI